MTARVIFKYFLKDRRSYSNSFSYVREMSVVVHVNEEQTCYLIQKFSGQIFTINKLHNEDIYMKNCFNCFKEYINEIFAVFSKRTHKTS